jgi:hypothetical protein
MNTMCDMFYDLTPSAAKDHSMQSMQDLKRKIQARGDEWSFEFRREIARIEAFQKVAEGEVDAIILEIQTNAIKALQAEECRIRQIRRCIDGLRAPSHDAFPSAFYARRLKEIEGTVIDDDYAEFAWEANRVKEASIFTLEHYLATSKKREELKKTMSVELSGEV